MGTVGSSRGTVDELQHRIEKRNKTHDQVGSLQVWGMSGTDVLLRAMVVDKVNGVDATAQGTGGLRNSRGG